MNVAPGDLAMVIAPHVGAGAFVVVEEALTLPVGVTLMLPQPSGPVVFYTSNGCASWIVKGYVHHERSGPVGPLCWVCDHLLRKIDPPKEGKEDWLPPVPKEDHAERVMRGLEGLTFRPHRGPYRYRRDVPEDWS